MFGRILNILKVVGPVIYHNLLGGKNLTIHIKGKDVTVHLPDDLPTL